ncbi:acetoacetyl-CoA synthase [Paramagnetospirillum kuznetsovii]|uniref:Acetoacetyl-CoA synthase n=1 Tax=Paramagnetospirillum kuznetsovii TaxID=2053833 RepID=A0A364P306_9PROT|nr:type II toxin-antitoxin system CcdA family antitoxin [Paramagnetospirillum kuznetsovii]RAU23676.1 acetoacetyl-CoA synthase [Paramagnetospirillum kuznetsovii]
MNTLFDPKAPKKAVNLSINSDLLRQARELGLNLSQALEQGIGEAVRAAKAKDWSEENREAIEARHRWVEENGLWSDGLRLF